MYERKIKRVGGMIFEMILCHTSSVERLSENFDKGAATLECTESMSYNYLPEIGAPAYHFYFNVSCFYRIIWKELSMVRLPIWQLDQYIQNSFTKTKPNPRSKNANPDLGTQRYSCQNGSMIGSHNIYQHKSWWFDTD